MKNLNTKVDTLTVKVDTLSGTVSKLAVTVEKLAENMESGFKSVKIQNTENLESLARSVNRGFEDAEKRVGERFDKIDERFINVDQRFDTVDKRFQSLEKSINERLFVFGDELRGQQNKMARVEKVLKIG
jgi:chaperonin cofactor prefoldin